MPAPLPTVQQMAERGPYGVGVITLDLVDASRPTEANRGYPGAPDRALPTDVWYPAAASAEMPEQPDAPAYASDGPYPLILFAHGFSSFRRQSVSYMQHLASHGYVVAAMDFPGTNIVAAGGPRLYHLLDQPADVSFVIDELQARDAEPGWVLAGLVDFEHIGMTGHSLGGLTTMLAAYGERADPRIDAIAPISPPACYLPEGLARNVSLPAMIIGGSKELIVSPSWIARAYEIASPPKYYASIIGADHIRFGDFDFTDESLPGIVDRVSGGGHGRRCRADCFCTQIRSNSLYAARGFRGRADRWRAPAGAHAHRRHPVLRRLSEGRCGSPALPHGDPADVRRHSLPKHPRLNRLDGLNAEA